MALSSDHGIRRVRSSDRDPITTPLLAEESKQEDKTTEARLTALQHCIQQCSEHQQAILRRCYLGPESIADVAAALGRERTALYKQLARLKEKLRDCIRLRLAREGVG